MAIELFDAKRNLNQPALRLCSPFWWLAGLILCAVLCASTACAAQPTPPDIARLIQQAGDTEDEMERLRLLRQLASRPDLSPALRADLEKLLPVVQEWADGKSRFVEDTSRAAENGYLCRFINSRVRPHGLRRRSVSFWKTTARLARRVISAGAWPIRTDTDTGGSERHRPYPQKHGKDKRPADTSGAAPAAAPVVQAPSCSQVVAHPNPT